MRLVSSQENAIYAVVDQSGFERGDIVIDHAPAGSHTTERNPVLRFKDSDSFLVIGGNGPLYQVRRSPGAGKLQDEVSVNGWQNVLRRIEEWLGLLKYELAEAERAHSATGRTPEWALKELPPEYNETVAQIEALENNERRLRRMAGLLWETGEPLNKLVRDAFDAIGFQADTTAPGTTFDVTVSLPGCRLLIEVTGIEAQVNKGSKKIAQVLSAHQTVAQPDDRVCLAVNAYREMPIDERRNKEVVTRDALALLVRLDALIFTTSDLFMVWKLSRTDPERARQQIESLRTVSPGLVRLAAGDVKS